MPAVQDTTICGNFAGAADIFNPSCSGLCTDLVQNPANYNDAYFEVSYVRVFTKYVSIFSLIFVV